MSRSCRRRSPSTASRCRRPTPRSSSTSPAPRPRRRLRRSRVSSSRTMPPDRAEKARPAATAGRHPTVWSSAATARISCVRAVDEANCGALKLAIGDGDREILHPRTMRAQGHHPGGRSGRAPRPCAMACAPVLEMRLARKGRAAPHLDAGVQADGRCAWRRAARTPVLRPSSRPGRPRTPAPRRPWPPSRGQPIADLRPANPCNPHASPAGRVTLQAAGRNRAKRRR